MLSLAWLISVLPVFIAGLAEDLGYFVSPRSRIFFALVSAIVAVALTGVWVSRANSPILDWAMAVPAIGITLTVFFSAGFCHAVNLIDGMNGLAGTTIITGALGCFSVALLAAQPTIAFLALLLASAVAGFLLMNWPSARLFLGDAGAYSVGHLLVWLLILLSSYTAEAAIPALLLMIFWPLADVLHTMLRRWAKGVSILKPDRMHLHQKVRRALDIRFFGYRGRSRSNPLTTLILLPFIVSPVATGVIFWNNPGAAWFALCVYMGAFSLAHALIISFARATTR